MSRSKKFLVLEYLYQIKPPQKFDLADNTFQNIILVNCTWNTWHVGACSVTCGEGVRVNHRTKLQEELHGGTECEGETTETETCSAPNKCPSKPSVNNNIVIVLADL